MGREMGCRDCSRGMGATLIPKLQLVLDSGPGLELEASGFFKIRSLGFRGSGWRGACRQMVLAHKAYETEQKLPLQDVALHADGRNKH